MRTGRMGDETLLLAASAVEAFLVFLILGYGALYAHQHLHASYALASQAAALPGLAWFAGAWVWGGVSRRWRFVRVAAIALASYSVLAVAVWVVHTALWFAIVLGVVSLGTSGFRPAVVGYLIQAAEGSAGTRLARRVRWQSIGWLVGGVLGGVLYAASPVSYPVMLTVLGAGTAAAACLLAWRPDRRVAVPPVATRPAVGVPVRARQLIPVLVPYFLAYCAIEGLVTTLGLFLTAAHLSSGWVGGSTTLRTAVGMVGAAWYGRWADRWGGRRFLLLLFGAFTAVFAGIAAIPNPIVIIVLFAVVLNSPLTLGVQLVLADAVPAESHGLAMGWVQSVSGLAIFVGTTVLGVAAELVGARAIPAMAAGLMAVAAVLWLVEAYAWHRPRAAVASCGGRPEKR